MRQGESAADRPHDWLSDAISDLTALQRTLDEKLGGEFRELRDGGDNERLKTAADLWAINQLIKAILHRQQVVERTDEVAFYRLQTVLYAKVAAHTRRMAEALAIDGVMRNALSRVAAARILEVHQGTIARWVNGTKKRGRLPVDRFNDQYREVLHTNPEKFMADENIDPDT